MIRNRTTGYWIAGTDDRSTGTRAIDKPANAASGSAPPGRSQTAEDILDIAEALIQTRGYNAFSYQDIADPLGIRKASIHYHFPAKADLGLAVVDRYADRFSAALSAIAVDDSQPSMAMLERYLEPYRGFAGTPDKVCLCGGLAGEMPALPSPMRARVARFFAEHQAWLADILDRGQRRGEFALPDTAARTGRLAFSALQGALLVKRTTGRDAELEDVVAVLKRQLTGGAEGR